MAHSVRGSAARVDNDARATQEAVPQPTVELLSQRRGTRIEVLLATVHLQRLAAQLRSRRAVEMRVSEDVGGWRVGPTTQKLRATAV